MATERNTRMPKQHNSQPNIDSRFDAGLDAYEIGDFETTLDIWEPLAEQGNAAAQSQLG